MSSNKLTIALAGFILLIVSSCANPIIKSSDVDIWSFDSLSTINGHTVEHSGHPKVVHSPLGKAVSFDGDGDRLLVNTNPLGDATEFTIEIVFKPYDVFPNNNEPRFFHIQSHDNPNRRLTIELRLNDRKQWYLDAYIKSEKSQFTLIDETKVHPINEWAHAAITYQNGEFISYVNGEKELTGKVEYLPIPADAKTSIGARMNQIHWYNGEILRVAVSKKLLKPEEFVLLETVKK